MRCLVLAFVALCLAAGSAPAAPAPPASDGIYDAYGRMAEALARKDTGALRALFAPGYTRTDAEGRSATPAEVEAEWSRRFTQAGTFGPVRFEQEPSAGAAGAAGGSIRVRVRRVLFYRPAAGGPELYEETRWSDTWSRGPDGWQLAAQEALGYSVDGAVEPAEVPLHSARLARLSRELPSGKAAEARFWEEVAGNGPLVEPVAGDPHSRWVTYLWHGDPRTLKVAMNGALPGEARPKPLARLGASQVWYRTEQTPTDSRFVYIFLVTRSVTRPGGSPETVTVTASYPDLLNPRMFNGFPVLQLPEAASQTWIVPDPHVPHGKTVQRRLPSRALNGERTVTVYTPPGYASAGPECRLLILLDGEDYQRLIPTPTILDNLLAQGKIPPTVALLVHSGGTRGQDLRFSEGFARFIAEELVPWARAGYRVSRRREAVTLGGLSLGGLTAGYCALRYPHTFGSVLSQSGAFWQSPDGAGPNPEPGWLARQFAARPRCPARFYLEVGRFESAEMVANNRRLRDVLRAKGCAVRYSEFDGGHDYLTWRGTLADALIALQRREWKEPAGEP
jgi:enterochelin esterase-like enzyme